MPTDIKDDQYADCSDIVRKLGSEAQLTLGFGLDGRVLSKGEYAIDVNSTVTTAVCPAMTLARSLEMSHSNTPDALLRPPSHNS